MQFTINIVYLFLLETKTTYWDILKTFFLISNKTSFSQRLSKLSNKIKSLKILHIILMYQYQSLSRVILVKHLLTIYLKKKYFITRTCEIHCFLIVKCHKDFRVVLVRIYTPMCLIEIDTLLFCNNNVLIEPIISVLKPRKQVFDTP